MKFNLTFYIETENDIDFNEGTLGDLIDYLNENPSVIKDVKIITKDKKEKKKELKINDKN